MASDKRKRVVAITGGSRGIGLALAKRLAARGDTVILIARDPSALENAKREIAEAGGRAETLVCDVTDGDRLATELAVKAKELGALDAIVASAGIGAATPATDFDLAEARRIVNINVVGLMATCAAAIPIMIEQKRGHIVGLASLAGYRGLPGNAAYCASKAAVREFVEALRLDLAPRGIAVTSVNPGWVETDMTASNKAFMPMMLSADRVARAIERALDRPGGRVSMPFPINAFTRLGQALPASIYDLSVRGRQWPFKHEDKS